MSYPLLKIKKGKEKSLLRFHPWIFSGAVESLEQINKDCIVDIRDFGGNRIGYGFAEQKSQIICRVFEFTTSDLHFDSNYWAIKIKQSQEFKKSLLTKEETDCFRLIHAEGDYFPGLICDIYKDVAVVQFRIRATWELREEITAALVQSGFPYVYSKSPAYSDIKQGWLTSSGPDKVEVKENGIRFSVDFINGQKTGFFLDQRENRKLLGHYAPGKKVLNCFSYTGGFSMYALKAGASTVDSVDISKEATEHAKYNGILNGYIENHQTIASDCFEYLRKIPQDYDIIVLDPPAFCKDIRSVTQASRGYKDINLSALKRMKPGSLLFTFSCSQHISRDLFQKIIFGASADSGRKVRIIHQLSQGPDHPVNIYHPEGDYLKGLVLEVL